MRIGRGLKDRKEEGRRIGKKCRIKPSGGGSHGVAAASPASRLCLFSSAAFRRPLLFASSSSLVVVGEVGEYQSLDSNNYLSHFHSTLISNQHKHMECIFDSGNRGLLAISTLYSPLFVIIKYSRGRFHIFNKFRITKKNNSYAYTTHA